MVTKVSAARRRVLNQNVLGERCDDVDNVLATVEHEQHLLVLID
jgi:hypothetical protein